MRGITWGLINYFSNVDYVSLGIESLQSQFESLNDNIYYSYRPEPHFEYRTQRAGNELLISFSHTI